MYHRRATYPSMTKSTDIRARIEPDKKAAGKEILEQLGMSEAEFLNVCWSQLILRKGMPFDVRIPNAETVAALNEPRGQGKRYKNAREMFADIMAEED